MARAARERSDHEVERVETGAGTGLVVMVGVLATACGSGGDDKSSSSNGPVELTLQDHQKPRVELLRKLLPQFEQAMKAQGKQITVKLIEGPAEDGAFKSKLTLDYNSGNAPDVTSIGAANASSSPPAVTCWT